MLSSPQGQASQAGQVDASDLMMLPPLVPDAPPSATQPLGLPVWASSYNASPHIRPLLLSVNQVPRDLLP